MKSLFTFLFAAWSLSSSALAFGRALLSFNRPTSPIVRRLAKEDDDQADSLAKASWYAVEAFGRVFGAARKGQTEEATAPYSTSDPPSSMQETLARLQADNGRAYFLSGEVDELIYDPECEFADPFVSFRGRRRFVDNLANLGSFITDYSAKPLDYSTEDNAVTTKFMVKLRLNLPWQPVLAWPWGVRCEVDPATNLVARHVESWDIAPLDGVMQIFRRATTDV